MSGLDLNHLESYSNAEMARFLDDNTDPVVQDLCRRLLDKRSEDASALDVAETNLSVAEDNLKNAEGKLTDTEAARDEFEKKLETALDDAAEVQERVEQLEAHLNKLGLALPEAA